MITDPKEGLTAVEISSSMDITVSDSDVIQILTNASDGNIGTCVMPFQDRYDNNAMQLN